jgi:sulfite reductase (NADPH) flavoprotein alpha-component
MAGLGTGAAPFRAFIQHRSLLKRQGTPVGPMVYYFGSRHRSQEYLYGEEIEAYIKDGILTHVGLAFSRDTNSKVYIQHKMRQDAQYLAGLIAGADGGPETNGAFYLCGPTWPVPDVYEALVNALVKYAGKTAETASQYIEKLKEDERYVLEVCGPYFSMCSIVHNNPRRSTEFMIIYKASNLALEKLVHRKYLAYIGT